MRDQIEAALRERCRVRGRLPSVRELATEFAASPQTVHKALRRLAEEGLVHALDRKGYRWGPAEEALSSHGGEAAEDRFRTQFLSDLRQGAHHPWKELPSRSALAQLYGVGVRSAGRVLSELAARGVLTRHGRGFFALDRPRQAAPATSVLVVVRCDAQGELQLDSEREIDFLKSVRRELFERNLGMVRVGYDERGKGRLLDRLGNEVDPADRRRPLLGAVVSTWLVREPVRLLERISRLAIPISAWWEHRADLFPRRRYPEGLAGFDLSFGESAGAAVGRHLVSRGRMDVAFVSPYHGNEWSPARLRGLRDQVELHGGRVVEFVEKGVHSPWHLRRQGEDPPGPRDLEGILEGFLRDPRLQSLPTWVVVNDLAAVAMHRLLRRRGGPVPLLVGFDNSSDSERLGLDSFEFHTDGMVRQMLHHIVAPDAEIFSGSPIQEMVGRLVVRSESP